MEFGIFDHLDRNDLPLADYYEARLKIIESYDRLGFYAYHVAEHHSTPIGLAPSPSVFLSAVAQRTRRLRFGPLVYALPRPALTFHGRYFDVDSVPMNLGPRHQPHPRVWYGVHAPESAERAARKGLRVVSLDPRAATRASFDSFRTAWRDAWGDTPLP